MSKRLLWLAALGVVAAGLLGWRAISASTPDEPYRGLPDPFPTLRPIDPPGVEVLAPGAAEVTPAPTATPMPRPSPGADLATEDEVRQIALREGSVLQMGGGADSAAEISSVILATTGEYDRGTLRFREYAPDYPLWVITLRGLFEAPYGPPGAGHIVGREATLYIEPATRAVLGMTLRDAVRPTATPESVP
jgi:hypothetical protein